MRRYLAAFGPASVMDAQMWCGLTKLREVFDRLRPGLRVFRDDDGRELFDLPEAPRPGSGHAGPAALPLRLREPPALVRRPVAGHHPERTAGIVVRENVTISTFLVDGLVAGTWTLERTRDRATLAIARLTRLPRDDERALIAPKRRPCSRSWRPTPPITTSGPSTPEPPTGDAGAIVETMSIEIRHPGDDEMPAFIEALQTGFLERHGDVTRIADEMRPIWDLDRVWAAVDGDRICGTYRSWATELTVPGGAQLPAAAVAAVTVLPTHRRRGILRAMSAAEHGAIRERGEVFAVLHAAEWPIYGRFGYGPATTEAAWTLDARQAAFHGERGDGRIRDRDARAPRSGTSSRASSSDGGARAGIAPPP